MPRQPQSIVINTDGACSGNPGPGGFAAIIVIDGHETAVTGGAPATTNNRMELAAVIEALRFAQKAPANAGVPIEVRSDSTYVVHAFNKGWINKWKRDGFHTRTNGDLWEALDKLTVGQDIIWTWVRGHSGDAMNAPQPHPAAGPATGSRSHAPQPHPAAGPTGSTTSPYPPRRHRNNPRRRKRPRRKPTRLPIPAVPSATPWNRTPAQPPAPNSPSTGWRPETRTPPGPPCAPPWPSWPASRQSSNNSAETQATQSEKAGHKAVEEAPHHERGPQNINLAGLRRRETSGNPGPKGPGRHTAHHLPQHPGVLRAQRIPRHAARPRAAGVPGGRIQRPGLRHPEKWQCGRSTPKCGAPG